MNAQTKEGRGNGALGSRCPCAFLDHPVKLPTGHAWRKYKTIPRLGEEERGGRGGKKPVPQPDTVLFHVDYLLNLFKTSVIGGYEESHSPVWEPEAQRGPETQNDTARKEQAGARPR